ncbi:MAG: hypothetical protein ABI354_01780 [Candidatus Saccharimonadales bacterium]
MTNNLPADYPQATPGLAARANLVAHELAEQHNGRPQDTIESFTTARGSIYTYDEDGHTTRFKTATSQEQPKQDLTVFVEVGPRDVGTVAAAYLFRGINEATKIEVVEIQPDGQPRVVTDAAEVTLPGSLRVATFKGTRMVKNRPASLFPQPGLYTFDSRRFDEGGVTRTERHLGHKIISVKPKGIG